MTDEYLIAMLRNNVGVSEAACRAAKAAADRIEQLVVEKNAATAAAYEVAVSWLIDAGIAGDGKDDPLASSIRALAKPDQTAAIREAALREAVKSLRDWQNNLIRHRYKETAITVGMSADVVEALIGEKK